MKIYAAIYEEYVNDPKLVGVYSTLAQAYHEIQARFRPSETIEDEIITDNCIKVSTNRFDYWIYISTLDE